MVSGLHNVLMDRISTAREVIRCSGTYYLREPQVWVAESGDTRDRKLLEKALYHQSSQLE
jgi:hypothetical protein